MKQKIWLVIHEENACLVRATTALNARFSASTTLGGEWHLDTFTKEIDREGPEGVIITMQSPSIPL